jgi:hypothetical protein
MFVATMVKCLHQISIIFRRLSLIEGTYSDTSCSHLSHLFILDLTTKSASYTSYWKMNWTEREGSGRGLTWRAVPPVVSKARGKHANLICSTFRTFVIRWLWKVIKNEFLRHGRRSLPLNLKTGNPENGAWVLGTQSCGSVPLDLKSTVIIINSLLRICWHKSHKPSSSDNTGT